MKKHCIIGASTVALCAALAGHSAFANVLQARTVTVPVIADYNAAQVKAAGDIVTVNPFLATYHVNSGSLEINSRFTVTLPSGFSFGSQPALFPSGATTFVLSSGGIGAQTATYTVAGAALTGGEQAVLDTFSVQGVSALETPIPVIGALPIEMQSTNNALITNNDPKPLSAKAFASEPGLAAIYEGGFVFIDLSSPTLGTLFTTGSDTTTTPIIALLTAPESETGATPVLSPNGAPNSLASTDTATITIPGLFNGLSGAFVAPDGSCSTPVATGTVTANQITIPGVPVGGNLTVCITSSGTTLLQQNLNGFTLALAPGTSTDFLGTSAVLDGFPGVITYSGGGVINVTNFFTGSDSGYASLLRVNNAGTADSNIFALVQPDTGGPALSGSLGSIGAGMGTVFSEAQVQAAVTGLDLANSTQRATLQLIVTGDPTQVKASTFLVSPGGFVGNVGTQQNSFEP